MQYLGYAANMHHHGNAAHIKHHGNVANIQLCGNAANMQHHGSAVNVQLWGNAANMQHHGNAANMQHQHTEPLQHSQNAVFRQSSQLAVPWCCSQCTIPWHCSQCTIPWHGSQCMDPVMVAGAQFPLSMSGLGHMQCLDPYLQGLNGRHSLCRGPPLWQGNGNQPPNPHTRRIEESTESRPRGHKNDLEIVPKLHKIRGIRGGQSTHMSQRVRRELFSESEESSDSQEEGPSNKEKVYFPSKHS